MPEVRAKAAVSFDKSRKALLVGLTARAKGKETDRVIPFGNNDVPNFLRKLDRFEFSSRQTCLMVK